MQKQKTTSVVVVALLFAATALFLFTRKEQVAAPPPVKVAEQPNVAPPTTTVAETATEAPAPEPANESVKNQPAATIPVAAKKASKENVEEAKKTDEAPTQPAAEEAKKQIVETKPAPLPTGNLSAYFQNQVGVTYRLVSVSCTIDGTSACGQGSGKSFSMFNRKLDAGPHRLQVAAVYEGAGGPFSYANGYHFTVKSGRQLTVDADRATQVNVMVHETGGPTTPMEQRLRMAFSTK